jgi:DNA polymerase
MRRTVHEVLARFDEAIGLDRVPRAASSGPARASMPAPVLPAADDALAPWRAPRDSLRAPRAEAAAPDAPPRAARLATEGITLLAAPADAAEKAARLAEIADRHAATCPHCTAARGHTQLVFGEGNPDAELLFVGEAPGEVEDQLGRPFVGPAGQKLDEMIRAMGLRREDVYIANVLKSRPPDNRTPLPDEVERCGPFLIEQLLAVRPRVIVTLGGPATKLVVGTDAGITRLRGTWQEWSPPAGSDCAPISVMPTYHPSYVLRNYTPKVRGEVWSDLKRVLERLGRQPGGASASGS